MSSSTIIKRRNLELDYSLIFDDEESRAEFISTVKGMRSILEDLEKDLSELTEGKKTSTEGLNVEDIKEENLYKEIYKNLGTIKGNIKKVKIIIKEERTSVINID